MGCHDFPSLLTQKKIHRSSFLDPWTIPCQRGAVAAVMVLLTSSALPRGLSRSKQIAGWWLSPTLVDI